MRALFIILIFVPLVSEAIDLTGGLWVEIDRETDCRYILEFRDTGDYFILNECHENRETGIKETGKYLLCDANLELSSRMVMSEFSLFKSKLKNLIVVIELEEENLVILNKGNTSKFRKVSNAH